MRCKLTLLILLLSGCGKDQRNSTRPEDFKSQQVLNCKVVQTLEGAEIQCPDGSRAFVSNGSQGLPGLNGTNGVNGSSCSVQQTLTGAEIRCTDGTFALIVNGRDGQNGTNGLNGADGSSCSISSIQNGARLSCENGQVEVYNGLQGASCGVTSTSNGAIIQCGASSAIVYDGEDSAISAYTVVELINPCGDQPGFDEILMRLANGQIVAHYSHGNRQFLTILQAGNFETTDGTNCEFNVDSHNNVTW